MMNFDQILSSYQAYIRAREVQDDIEWAERRESKSDERGSKTEAE